MHNFQIARTGVVIFCQDNTIVPYPLIQGTLVGVFRPQVGRPPNRGLITGVIGDFPFCRLPVGLCHSPVRWAPGTFCLFVPWSGLAPGTEG